MGHRTGGCTQTGRRVLGGGTSCCQRQWNHGNHLRSGRRGRRLGSNVQNHSRRGCGGRCSARSTGRCGARLGSGPGRRTRRGGGGGGRGGSAIPAVQRVHPLRSSFSCTRIGGTTVAYGTVVPGLVKNAKITGR